MTSPHNSSTSLSQRSHRNRSNRDPMIRHSGRAHIRGKIRRVWRPRYLELVSNAGMHIEYCCSKEWGSICACLKFLLVQPLCSFKVWFRIYSLLRTTASCWYYHAGGGRLAARKHGNQRYIDYSSRSNNRCDNPPGFACRIASGKFRLSVSRTTCRMQPDEFK